LSQKTVIALTFWSRLSTVTQVIPATYKPARTTIQLGPLYAEQEEER